MHENSLGAEERRGSGCMNISGVDEHLDQD